MPRQKSASAAIVVLVFAGGLAGCGDSKAPSEDVFRAGLEPLVRDVYCRGLDVVEFEVEGQDTKSTFPLITTPTRARYGVGADGSSLAMLDGLASQAYVTRTTFEKPARQVGSDDPYVRQPLIAYAPTQKGASYLRAIERKATNRMVSVPSVCIAKGEVVDVVRWSEPVDFFGRRLSQVTYTYHGVDPIPVMPKPEQAAMEKPKEATKPFELQSDGWRPMSR